MSRHPKTQSLIDETFAILAAHHPMTLRQAYYQLVSRQVLENKESVYKGLSRTLVLARQEGAIPWEWIEDRTRRPRAVSMWDDLPDFADTVCRAYRRDVWATQSRRVECWLEKDALSGIFEDVLNAYGVTLRVGRGYDSLSSIYNAAESYGDGSGVTVLYFGDFDPSGENMEVSLRKRLSEFGCRPEIVRIAITRFDIDKYNLPPNPTKATDTRRTAFIAKHGDITVELDALPMATLRERIETEVRKRMDLDALDQVRATEQDERAYLRTILSGADHAV